VPLPIFQLAYKMSLIFSTNNKSLVITGKTFYIKDVLKTLGAAWNPNLKMWELPIDLDSADLRAQLCKKVKINIQNIQANKKAEEKMRIKYLASHEAVMDALKAKESGNMNYHWICCENCVVLDWGRQHTSCQSCGHDNGLWKETFFVRGRLYTGD
jgi:hypothetical protein